MAIIMPFDSFSREGAKDDPPPSPNPPPSLLFTKSHLPFPDPPPALLFTKSVLSFPGPHRDSTVLQNCSFSPLCILDDP